MVLRPVEDFKRFTLSLVRAMKFENFRDEIDNLSFTYGGMVLYNNDCKKDNQHQYVSYRDAKDSRVVKTSKYSTDISNLLPKEFLDVIGDNPDLLKAALMVLYRSIMLGATYDNLIISKNLFTYFRNNLRVKTRFINVSIAVDRQLKWLSTADISNGKPLTESYNIDDSLFAILKKNSTSKEHLDRLKENIIRLRFIRKTYKLGIDERDLIFLVLASRTMISKVS